MGERSIIAPKVFERAFETEGPDQKWVAEFTYIWTAEGLPYVAVAIDWFSRRVSGWSMKETMTAQMVTGALIPLMVCKQTTAMQWIAIWRKRRPTELLRHSDQGSCTDEPFQGLMADNGVTCAMSRSGNAWNNAVMDSFFSSLSIERVKHKVYRTCDQTRADLSDCIERLYNPPCRHPTIGYLSPMQYEERAVKAQVALHETCRWTFIADTRAVRFLRPIFIQLTAVNLKAPFSAAVSSPFDVLNAAIIFCRFSASELNDVLTAVVSSTIAALCCVV